MLKQLCQKMITPIIKQRILKIFSTEIKKGRREENKTRIPIPYTKKPITQDQLNIGTLQYKGGP